MVSQPSFADDHHAQALAELKGLCEKNEVYWPASELEVHPAKGHNDDINSMYDLYSVFNV